MIQVATVIFCLLYAGCMSNPATVKLDEGRSARYLDKSALEGVILALQNLSYPLTRAEVLDRLALTGRQLPSLRSTDGSSLPKNLDPFTDDHELIHLTAREKESRSYSLLLWYDSSARNLDGESFVKAKIINYAEMLVADDGTGDAPKATYVLQSSRYPYVRLKYPNVSKEQPKGQL